VADIAITCHHCKSVNTLSQFVDDTQLRCRACGERILKSGKAPDAVEGEGPEASDAPRKQSTLRLAKRRQESPETTAEEPSTLTPIFPTSPTDDPNRKLEIRPKVNVTRRGISHALVAAGLFVVLGGVMGYLRYGGVLSPKHLALAAKYAWIVIVGFYVMIVIKAMTDNMLQGILCLLVPGYVLYYIFAVSDEFYLRALLAGALIGFGQDASVTLNRVALSAADSVHHFIEGGGGDIR